MAKMLQVRNVPDRLHEELTRRARSEGVTLTEYVEQLLRRELARPPRREVFSRVASSSRVDLKTSAAELIRGGRRQR